MVNTLYEGHVLSLKRVGKLENGFKRWGDGRTGVENGPAARLR